MSLKSLPHRPAPAATDGVTIVTEQIEKPDIDNRTYRWIRLANSLDVLIAHDPTTEKASAALDVNVGSFSDESSMPGMAHAVEHLLFMGTEKYPTENMYSQYLSANSGSSNAYTAATSTNYYFDISAKPADDSEPTDENPSPFRKALDIFAQFFVKPLFLEETLERELKAVDSENKKNLQNDTWRLYQLDKSLSNPAHPFFNFSTGNFEVLKLIPEAQGINVRDKFIEFYNTHYSANRMKLVVLGREPLDVLQKWVVESFSAVPNKGLPRNTWPDEPPFRPEDLRKVIYAKPVHDKRELSITFPTFDEEPFWESKPASYLSYLIGHEGPGSLLSYLKGKGWVDSLSTANGSMCPGSPGTFETEIRLTADGLTHYKEVVKAFFQYVALLHENPPAKLYFDERKLLNEVTFKFRQKASESGFTSRTSSVMQQKFPPEMILSGHYKLVHWKPELIKKVLSYLRPDNMRLTIVNQQFPGNWNAREKWYNTEYRYDDLDADFIRELEQAMNSPSGQRPAELHLPEPNKFIPTNLAVDMVKAPVPAIAPKLVRLDEQSRTWWKKDDTFGVPKATVVIYVRQPLANATCQNSAQMRLFREMVSDALEEHAYDAEVAGLTYHVGLEPTGFTIDLSGYNDKLPVLLEQVLLKIRNVEFSEKRFDIIKERLSRRFRNWGLQNAYQLIGHKTQCLYSEIEYPVPAVLKYLETAELENLKAFHHLLLSQAAYEVLVLGNMNKSEALKVTDLVKSTLKCGVLPIAELPALRSMQFPPGSNLVYNEVLEDPDNINNCIEYWFDCGSNTDITSRAKSLLFEQMLQEPTFDQLRTKEQLGYVVFSGYRSWRNLLFFRVLIQSEKYPQYLHSRIQTFMEGRRRMIEGLTEAELEAHKRSVIVARLKKAENLSSEASRIQSHLHQSTYRFDTAQQDAEAVKKLTKEDMLAFYDERISDKSTTRRKLVVNLFARGEPAVEKLVQRALERLPEGSLPELQAAVRATVVESVVRASSVPIQVDMAEKLGLPKEVSRSIIADLAGDVVKVGRERVVEQNDKKMEFDMPDETYGETSQYITDVKEWKSGLATAPIFRCQRPLRSFMEDYQKL